jgi:homoserine O-acetyltransferase
MILTDYYSRDVHGPYELFELGDFTLEEGGTIRNCRLAYTTFGKLSPARDNAILIMTWFAATNKIMEDVYIGRGRAIDPDRHFIVIVNQIGSGLSSSPNNTPAPYGMATFPRVRIGDDVRAQQLFLTKQFGIERIKLVIGGSMGAQQTYEWCVRFPDMVERAAALAGTARTTPHNRIWVQTLIEAITSDPAFAGGWYEPYAVREGLRRHGLQWTLMGLSSQMLKRELWRRLGFSSLEDFQLGFFDAMFLAMDPNSLLAMAWKWQHADVARNSGGDLTAALGSIRAKTFVMPISTDMFFPVEDCAAEQAMIPGSELRIVDSVWGHVALYGPDPAYRSEIDRVLADLLATPV